MLKALAQTISKYQIIPISASIVVKDFMSMPTIHRRLFTGALLDDEKGKLVGTGSPNKPYFLPFQFILRMVTNQARPGEKAHLFCGLDRPFAEYAVTLFAERKNRPGHRPDWESRKRLGDIAFPLASERPQLQAADLLVHLLYQHDLKLYAQNKLGEGPPTGLLKLCLNNTGVLPNRRHVYFHKKSLTDGIRRSYDRPNLRNWDKN
jgi:hypothetical protein